MKNGRWAFDWGSRAGKLVFVSLDDIDGAPVYSARLEDFIREYEPKQLFAETTFESYEVDRYNYVLDVAKMHGTAIYTLSSRTTAHRRNEIGTEKDDLGDARLIARLALEFVNGKGTQNPGNGHASPHPFTTHFRLARPRGAVERTMSDLRKRLTKELVKLRREGYPKTSPVLQQALQDLPPLSEIPAEHKNTLLRGKKFSPSFAISLAIASRMVREMAGGRDDFERLVGLCGTGYPSLIRSNIYHHSVGPKLRKKAGPQVRKERLKQLRKSARFVFSAVSKAAKGAGTNNPATGTSNPAPRSPYASL